MISGTNQSLSTFRNEPFSDFSLPHVAAQMRSAINEVRTQLPLQVPLHLRGQELTTESMIVSVNPACPDESIARHTAAVVAQVPMAIQQAQDAFPSWSAKQPRDRIDLLKSAASLLRERKMLFSAWMVLEAGKNWVEADADTAEAIDFLEYYARQAEHLANVSPDIQLPGEVDRLVYIPFGVGAILPPWNFPLAILAGMTCAAIVMGNTVVLKPSPFTPTIAAQFVALLTECGLPPGVVTLCQGGADFGDALVSHPQIQFVSFTGSKKVGLHIYSKVGHTIPGQTGLKRAILELGGKNSIIVAADSDLESAADGVVASAFGFNGQKCSACSRAIVHESVIKPFLELLKTRMQSLQQGDPENNFATGPVSSDVAYKRILDYIDQGRSRGKLLWGGEAMTPPEAGYFIKPTIFTDLKPDDPVCMEEIFGPVLCVIPFKTLDEALAIANGTEYALTGAIYSTSEETLDRAAREFQVGNLYLNRKCTGAMVGAHPFGGFKMSGTDSKAGGPDYLLHFGQAKSIARKI
jgi:1-pyrroline-5-carboxylate dehydrogenase